MPSISSSQKVIKVQTVTGLNIKRDFESGIISYPMALQSDVNLKIFVSE